MIRGILDGKLDHNVNSLPFVYNDFNYCYEPNFFDWLEANFCNDEHMEFWEKFNDTCFTGDIHRMSEDELISIMSKTWDKWIEYKESMGESNEIPPKPEWLITAEDTEYIELDDIVL